MENYKLYKIVCNKTDEVYYGITKRTLKQRLQLHESGCRNNNGSCSSCSIIKNNDYKILLIMDQIQDKKTAEYMEGVFIRNCKCINKQKIYKNQKDRYIKNKEQILKTRKVYKLKNKERIKKQRKEYRLKNKERLKKQQREYRLKQKLNK